AERATTSAWTLAPLLLAVGMFRLTRTRQARPAGSRRARRMAAAAAKAAAAVPAAVAGTGAATPGAAATTAANSAATAADATRLVSPAFRPHAGAPRFGRSV